HLLAVFVDQCIGHWVEIQSSCNSDSRCNFWRCHKRMRIRVTISTLRKVSVEGMYNTVFWCIFWVAVTRPLTNTWTTGIGEDLGIQLFKNLKNTISFSCISYLF